MAEMNEPTTGTKQNETDTQSLRLPFNLPFWTVWILLASVLLGITLLFLITVTWPHTPRYAGSYRIEMHTNPIDEALMVMVPAGEFEMGDDHESKDERPAHPVYLDGYWIYQTEVTNQMYKLCVKAKSCETPERTWSYRNEGHTNYPVGFISWFDATAYCTWAGGRLPTEAEWEKAAGGGDGRTYPWGKGINSTLANYSNRDWRYYSIAPVGRYPNGISPYGALDMAGNVLEWVSDFDTGYKTNYDAEEEGYKVTRGGSWKTPSLRVTDRFYHPPDGKYEDVGFRCVVPVEP